MPPPRFSILALAQIWSGTLADKLILSALRFRITMSRNSTGQLLNIFWIKAFTSRTGFSPSKAEWQCRVRKSPKCGILARGNNLKVDFSADKRFHMYKEKVDHAVLLLSHQRTYIHTFTMLARETRRWCSTTQEHNGDLKAVIATSYWDPLPIR